MPVKYLLTIICVHFLSYSFSQSPATIYVIGNIHDSVPNYHPQILLDILEVIQPDIVLHEVDSQGMAEYERERDPAGNEIRASNAYIYRHPLTRRMPFDYEGRNTHRRNMGMVPTDNLALQLLDSLYTVGQLSPADAGIYKSYIDLTAVLRSKATLSPEHFNNFQTDKIAHKRQDYQYKHLLKVIEERPEFQNRYVVKPDGDSISYREGYILMSAFWDLRNRTMATNIINIAESNPGKRLVVLTGFLHRYYLISELQHQNSGRYIIREFYE